MSAMNVKQVIVIRKDLKMRRGKEIAQGAHASMAWLTNRMKFLDNPYQEGELPPTDTRHIYYDLVMNEAEEKWVKGSFKKITVYVNSEDELRAIHKAAEDAGLTSHLIVDSGLTEFNGIPTATAVGVGPDTAEKIDPITKHLPLY